jgi:coenzyme PQQ precursor peptide PqqA
MSRWPAKKVLTSNLEGLSALLISSRTSPMTWTTPEIDEVCIGMEITSYDSAEI